MGRKKPQLGGFLVFAQRQIQLAEQGIQWAVLEGERVVEKLVFELVGEDAGAQVVQIGPGGFELVDAFQDGFGQSLVTCNGHQEVAVAAIGLLEKEDGLVAIVLAGGRQGLQHDDPVVHFLGAFVAWMAEVGALQDSLPESRLYTIHPSGSLAESEAVKYKNCF